MHDARFRKFYDMGVNSVQDPTWQSAFQGVYGVYPSLQIPHLSIFGNHDCACDSLCPARVCDAPVRAAPDLNDGGSMYPQIAYTYYAGNGPAQWWAPGRNWTASWTSASGKTGVNIVAIDTSPLIQGADMEAAPQCQAMAWLCRLVIAHACASILHRAGCAQLHRFIQRGDHRLRCERRR